jgi:hypothetical protein
LVNGEEKEEAASSIFSLHCQLNTDNLKLLPTSMFNVGCSMFKVHPPTFTSGPINSIIFGPMPETLSRSFNDR